MAHKRNSFGRSFLRGFEASFFPSLQSYLSRRKAEQDALDHGKSELEGVVAGAEITAGLMGVPDGAGDFPFPEGPTTRPGPDPENPAEGAFSLPETDQAFHDRIVTGIVSGRLQKFTESEIDKKIRPLIDERRLLQIPGFREFKAKNPDLSTPGLIKKFEENQGTIADSQFREQQIRKRVALRNGIENFDAADVAFTTSFMEDPQARKNFVTSMYSSKASQILQAGFNATLGMDGLPMDLTGEEIELVNRGILKRFVDSGVGLSEARAMTKTFMGIINTKNVAKTKLGIAAKKSVDDRVKKFTVGVRNESFVSHYLSKYREFASVGKRKNLTTELLNSLPLVASLAKPGEEPELSQVEIVRLFGESGLELTKVDGKGGVVSTSIPQLTDTLTGELLRKARGLEKVLNKRNLTLKGGLTGRAAIIAEIKKHPPQFKKVSITSSVFGTLSFLDEANGNDPDWNTRVDFYSDYLDPATGLEVPGVFARMAFNEYQRDLDRMQRYSALSNGNIIDTFQTEKIDSSVLGMTFDEILASGKFSQEQIDQILMLQNLQKDADASR